MASNDGNDWELCKENIQPLKKGRRVSTLMTALDDSKQSMLNMQKVEFEKKIRTYSGDDPLQVWHQYVLWVEQNYPKGGKDGDLIKLIESCFNYIYEKSGIDNYKNDCRFLDLWIKYADHCPNPNEVFTMLYSGSICTNFPAFYENWAYYYENCGNVKKANAVYEKGLEQQGLEERHLLQTSHKHFQMRVAKLTVENMQKEEDFVAPAEEDTRDLGNQLRVKEGTKNVRAPVGRVGNFVVGTAGNVKSERMGNSALPNFGIYQDENMPSFPKSSGPLRIPSSEQQKEDFRKPSKWTKAKSRPKEAIAVESLPDVKSLNFPVYADPESEKEQNKNKPIVTGALSEKKAQGSWKMPLFSGEPVVEKTKAMYCKSRVYCGTMEFSPEELRAMDYWENLKSAEETHDNINSGDSSNPNDAKSNWTPPVFEVEPFDPTKQPQYCKDKVYCNREEFSLEEIRARKYFETEAKNTEDMKLKDEIDNLKQMVLQQQEIIENLKKEKHDNETSEPVNAPNPSTSVVAKTPIKVVASSSVKPIVRLQQPAYEDSWVAINKSVAEPNETNWLDESTKGLLMMTASATATLPPELRLETTEITMSTPSRPQREKGEQTSLREVLPSPTINTKLANHLVAEFFNRTLSTSVYGNECQSKEDYENIEPPPYEEPFEIFHDEVPTAPKSIPFTIYQDEDISKKDPLANKGSNNKAEARTRRRALTLLTEPPVESSTKKHSPIKNEDDDDKENQSAGEEPKVKRVLSGILLPSQDIPVDEPMEDLAVRLEPEVKELTAAAAKPGLPEDFTIRLPNCGRDFAKMASIASTPNPWSCGLVPQKDIDDDFTMKAPAIVISKPKTSLGLQSRMSSLKINQSYIPAEEMPALEEFRSPLLPITEESSKSSSICSSKLKNVEPSPSPEKDMVLPKHSDSSESRTKKNVTILEDNFDPDKVAAVLWDMYPDFGEEADVPKNDNDHQIRKWAPERRQLLHREIPFPDMIDPFCNDLRSLLICSLKQPLENRGGFVTMHTKLPAVKPNSQLTLDKEVYRIRYLRGKGNYAQVYEAFTEDPMNVTMQLPSDDNFETAGSQMALKVQSPPCYWEFYICHELRQRLKEMNAATNLSDCFMQINRAYFFKQGSIFVTDYHARGSLLNLINGYKMAGKPVPQAIVIYCVIELLAIIDALHCCGIIHGDMKPDNLLVRCLPSELTDEPLSTDGGPFLLKVIDFGRSIDMNLLPDGASFTRKVNTNGFTCCEMKDGRPWTYQTDYYGLAATAHCLLWGSYMNVQKMGHKWMLSGVTMQRHWNKELWNLFFDQLLNVQSCLTCVDLKKLRRRFVAAFNDDFSISSITDNAFCMG